MNYKQKYLKYKSKYLEKKYGRQFKLKIDYENDLDYKQKYLKYKSKYLNIKYGGTIAAGLAVKVASTLAPPPVKVALIVGDKLLNTSIGKGALGVVNTVAHKAGELTKDQLTAKAKAAAELTKDQLTEKAKAAAELTTVAKLVKK
jgi:hypothetical protein